MATCSLLRRLAKTADQYPGSTDETVRTGVQQRQQQQRLNSRLPRWLGLRQEDAKANECLATRC
ncbi:hypothetical protein TYRP_018978 [Tyrophagus putrescentiae]|nr:hypothetical protein TYRP_018978 [Tyrophagus putrescentiae]